MAVRAVWCTGETFTFYPSSFNPSTDSIRVDVYDWDRFSNNDLLTRNLLPIAKYASAGTVEEWVPLNSVKGGSSAALQIKVRVPSFSISLFFREPITHEPPLPSLLAHR